MSSSAILESSLSFFFRIELEQARFCHELEVFQHHEAWMHMSR